jgi:hypothetical protein
VHLTFEQTGPDGLIVENEATFDTVARWNRVHRKFRVVIYGRGKEVEKIGHFLLTEIQAKPGTIYYFGDLDRTGIEMPFRLTCTLEQMGGRPIVPALSCYRLLLRQATSAISAFDVSDDRTSGEDETGQGWRIALEWVPVELRESVETLLVADQRIAQEAVGWELIQHETALI